MTLSQTEKSHFDPYAIRKDFPLLALSPKGKPLIYLDNAATSQKPKSVIERVSHYYEQENANIHRGVYRLSERATVAYEKARQATQQFVNAAFAHEIIFVRGATEGINLVAHCFGKKFLKAGDEIVVSALEHHSNIVPWQMLCEEKGCTLKVIPMNDAGELVMEAFDNLLSKKTKLVAVNHVSNALGTINPVKAIIEKAHSVGAKVLIDGAQAMPHLRVDVRDLNCDFYVFSGHKVFAPTGIGALYGKEELLNAMPPYQGGGDMIANVTFEKTTYNKLPHKFEAGTPHIAGVLGLHAALDYLNTIDFASAIVHEHRLVEYATKQLKEVAGIRLIGTAREKAGVVSFLVGDVHPHDVGTILDQDNICIRAGHHCAQPIMDRLKIPATARASFAFYNTMEEVDALVIGIKKVIEVFSR